MSCLRLKRTKFDFPDPAGGAHSAVPDPSWISWVLLLMELEGREGKRGGDGKKEGEGRERGLERGGRRKGGGRLCHGFLVT